ncbi:endonuclease MutS2 [Tyzzerella sp. OttesenSCG-928-J15]|nr:endonuclease MutS2 [Tyzzerella sp. OttesenSCG-928-J15]
MFINNEKSLNTLEYSKIISMLVENADTVAGKEKCAALKPSTDIEKIKEALDYTSQAAGMTLRKGRVSLGGARDISAAVKRSNVGGILSIPELLHVGDFLRACNRAASYGADKGKDENYPLLTPMFENILPADKLSREIERCILNEQDIADDASPALSSIRRSIKVANDRIKEHLNSIIHSQTYKNVLQDSVITIRGGRFCVPVRSDQRSSFPGIVHDQSGTGATLFMEPMSVVTLNNKIKELGIDENKEIEKILAGLSQLVSENGDILLGNLDIITELDFLFAKGKLSIDMMGTEPVFNDLGYINIRRGRHPLLNKATVVPTDIYLGKDFTTLLITGPNTGGKTVSLKTLGLFTLMGQAGLHIPAFDNSELAVFDDVFADIGDEQSIEQSLSTFSGHMKNIVKILGDVTNNSLVLLDELGAGTDPTEGAALAISIIQFLKNRGVRCAVTTHYSELKVYALQTEGIENASCEFDVESLRPTYKLLIGIPGKSNAFAISQKLGLDDEIINSARETLSKEDKRFEDLITDLEISRKTVMLEQERAAQYRREAEKLKSDAEQQKKRLAEQREKIIAEAKEEAKKLLMQAKNDADYILKELNKSAKGGDRQSAEASRRLIKEQLDGMGAGLSYDDAKDRKPPENLKVGDSVYIHNLGQKGVVSSEPDSNGDCMVKAGIMKVRANIADLSVIEEENAPKKVQKSFGGRSRTGKSLLISPEVDLRGLLVSEAIEKCDKYLDDAYLSGLKQVTIIHGKGTGALRSAITTHLKKHPHVVSHRLGSFGEGETGVTICELK